MIFERVSLGVLSKQNSSISWKSILLYRNICTYWYKCHAETANYRQWQNQRTEDKLVEHKKRRITILKTGSWTASSKTLHRSNLKRTIVRQVFTNEWSCRVNHTQRHQGKVPGKRSVFTLQPSLRSLLSALADATTSALPRRALRPQNWRLSLTCHSPAPGTCGNS